MDWTPRPWWARRWTSSTDRTEKEKNVKLIRSAIMAGIAKKVFDEARKPQNQQKIKDMIAQMSNKSGAKRPPKGRY
jgi:hypothetical protein